jgi:hypothetical protein
MSRVIAGPGAKVTTPTGFTMKFNEWAGTFNTPTVANAGFEDSGMAVPDATINKTSATMNFVINNSAAKNSITIPSGFYGKLYGFNANIDFGVGTAGGYEDSGHDWNEGTQLTMTGSATARGVVDSSPMNAAALGASFDQTKMSGALVINLTAALSISGYAIMTNVTENRSIDKIDEVSFDYEMTGNIFQSSGGPMPNGVVGANGYDPCLLKGVWVFTAYSGMCDEIGVGSISTSGIASNMTLQGSYDGNVTGTLNMVGCGAATIVRT